MNDQDRAVLQGECAADVMRRLHEHVFGEGPPRLATGFGLPDWAPALEVLIKGGIDLVVQIGGTSIDAMVASNRDAIRQFVSDRTLQFLQGLINDLQVPLKRLAPAPEAPHDAP